MDLLIIILETTSASDVRLLEVLAILAGSGAGALLGHRWRARSHRGEAAGGRGRRPPAAGPSH